MTKLRITLLILIGSMMTTHAAPHTTLFTPKTHTSKLGSLPYQVMAPADYVKTTRYPLVIFLHGAGERGSENTRQLKHGCAEFATPHNRNTHPAVVIAPQCPKNEWWSGDNLKMVFELIDTAEKEYSIDKKRIYITGLSMGGFGTWSALTHDSSRFAAAIPICGGGNPATAKKMTQVPIWVFHGDADTTVKPEKSRAMVEALKTLKGMVTYTEYPGVKHNSWSRTYKDQKVIDWLFEQKKR